MIAIRPFFDAHRHLREGELLYHMLRCLGPVRRCVAMANLADPVTDVARWRWYDQYIRRTANYLGVQIDPLVALYLTPETTPETIWLAFQAGCRVAKGMPRNQSTNAHQGLRTEDYQALDPVWDTMSRIGMRLALHGEHPNVTDERHREEAFLPILERLAGAHPELYVSLEHISTRAGVQAVSDLHQRVAGTITGHHLFLTREDVYEPEFNPHHKCMPIAKTPDDRQALQQAVLSGNPKFFLGSDCAPHPRQKKEGLGPDKAMSGVFTGPVLGPLLVDFFERNLGDGWISALENYTSLFGSQFYGLRPTEGSAVFAKEPWQVPAEVAGVVPYRAGEYLDWRLQSVS